MYPEYTVTAWINQVVSALNSHGNNQGTNGLAIERGLTALSQSLERIGEGYIDEMAQARKLREREIELQEEMMTKVSEPKPYVLGHRYDESYDDDIPF